MRDNGQLSRDLISFSISHLTIQLSTYIDGSCHCILLIPKMGTNVKLSELNEFISCPVCGGYLIDATTINECLHTFCKSCIVKHIKSDNNDCPKCNTIIHEHRPLDYIVQDRSKQDIVYKLVPQLYIAELEQRLAAHDTSDIDAVTELVLEKKFLDVVLVLKTKIPNNHQAQLETPSIVQKTIYLQCPLTVKTSHIRKLLSVKYQLRANDEVKLYYKGDILNDEDQISNLAQSLTFCLHYDISCEKHLMK